MPSVTVVIPTLTAGETLEECLDSLDRQTHRGFETIVVDNSCRRLVRPRSGIRIIENTRNRGYGEAVNQGWRAAGTPFVAALNDDAVAEPNWLSALLHAAEADGRIGMCASQVRLSHTSLDSAGMLIARDGSSKQRGHLENPARFNLPNEALCPSGSAALYRTAMLAEVGGFDDDFFLYCEDTDLGLRARWAGWRCVYVPDAIVDHHYSRSAGRASALKAYYVERNRLYLAIKNFPAPQLSMVPAAAAARYFWHIVSIFTGRGAAAEYRTEGSGVALVWFVVRAHFAALAALRGLLRKRAVVRRSARISSREFAALLRAHGISVREVASL